MPLYLLPTFKFNMLLALNKESRQTSRMDWDGSHGECQKQNLLQNERNGVAAVSLATKLGTIPHFSLLLRRLAKHGLKTPEEMAACAVGRGCHHYANMPKWRDIQTSPAPEISNEELAIGLLSPCHAYDPLLIRVGAQLLSSHQSNPETLVRLAEMERCVAPLKYIATCGRDTEPENPFWQDILQYLTTKRRTHPEFPESSIHISRFRSETGITNPFKPGAPKVVWLRLHPAP